MIFSKIAIRLSCFEQIFITIENLPAELYLKHLPIKKLENAYFENKFTFREQSTIEMNRILILSCCVITLIIKSDFISVSLKIKDSKRMKNYLKKWAYY